MVRIVEAPHALGVPGELLHIDWRTVSGGEGLQGGEQIIAGATPIWRAEFDFLAIGAERNVWIAFVDSLRGRAGAARFRTRQRCSKDLRARLGAAAPAPVLYSDGALHSDGSGFAPSAPTVSLSAAAAFWATDIRIDMGSYQKGLRGGDYIGIGGNLYRIETAWASTGTTMRAAINPPLRRAATAGAIVTTDPSVVMRVETDRDGWIARTASPVARPRISLRELPDLT